MSFLYLLSAMLATLMIIGGADAQRRPISLPGIFSAMRYQNTACEGDNEETGICLYENECLNRRGTPVGSCANGFSRCCSFKFTCGGETSQNETFFVNKQYPSNENDTNTCQVTVKKMPGICQLRLDFEEFNLSQPDENGFCTTDSFMVRTTIGERLPIICGENNGQHIYVDMGAASTNPVVLSIVTNGAKALRRWKIKISMIQCNHLDMAPSGCLQYHRSPTDIVKSLNWGPKIEYRARYLANLRYTVCIRTEENFCAIKWETAEPGSFQFGAPFEGKDNEFGECASSTFPFFGMNGKNGDWGNATELKIDPVVAVSGGLRKNLLQSSASKKLTTSSTTQRSTSTTTSSTTTTTTITPSVSTEQVSSSTTTTTSSPSTSAITEAANASSRQGRAEISSNSLPGVVQTERDPAIFSQRLCNGGASGLLCNFDDFVGIDQGSLEGTGQGEDRFCGTRMLEHDFVISRSKPFQLKVRSNGDHFNNAFNSQPGFALKYTQLPCVI